MKSMLVALSLGASAVLLSAGGASAASLLTPGVAPVTERLDVAPQQVRWVCTYGRCVWRPRSNVRVPIYAQSWGPPPRPNCFWTRRIGPQGQFHWQQVCR
ncbi:hypothetical protein K9U40_17620 [Xanthobacter autotrophicus]|uniref:hypothetical protein n=1 Tax=Xanthobacter TaxID=279 RepID=UPI0024AB6F85|nr:hypothetical protein [Xanthobacter autotrophicus]MDI4666127.1 hypothetical protein [Xanthobacter autotrophicus]